MESYRPDSNNIIVLSMITTVSAFLRNEAITGVVPADATLITVELIHLYRSVVEAKLFMISNYYLIFSHFSGCMAFIALRPQAASCPLASVH